MTDKPINYEGAYQEILTIISELERMELPVDQLSEKVKRAGELIKYCKAGLRNLEDDLDEQFKELEDL